MLLGDITTLVFGGLVDQLAFSDICFDFCSWLVRLLAADCLGFICPFHYNGIIRFWTMMCKDYYDPTSWLAHCNQVHVLASFRGYCDGPFWLQPVPLFWFLVGLI
ncbi:hypothetical protein IEQ34_020963 [Dendrobium chrysotoxum]|uniref:Uncharacterized protein n=1 Tax=Dendrobium chrysotoxum TaxID=161865 RepID=A0AAV7G1K9_DENCH|nr:hypothetical protein IEQ34_020963 [Dendrobium chrysotoxum]